MLIGNESANSVLGKYMDSVVDGDVNSIFLLGIGPKHVGKSTVIFDFVEKIVGDYINSDFLYIRDCSEFLGKKHTLKIELSSDSKKQIIEVEDEKLYQDIGVREVTKWLQKAPMGKVKILFVENMERMNASAANAFLKVSEEPLKNRIIIGTTSNASAVLDTILSRAVQIKFQPVGYDELIGYCEKNKLFVNSSTGSEGQKLREFICRMVMGKPGLLHRYMKLFEENTELEKTFLMAIDTLGAGNKLFASHQLLLTMKNAGILNSFLEGWISYCQEHEMFVKAERWLEVKKMLNSNVNVDNLLLWGLL